MVPTVVVPGCSASLGDSVGSLSAGGSSAGVGDLEEAQSLGLAVERLNLLAKGCSSDVFH